MPHPALEQAWTAERLDRLSALVKEHAFDFDAVARALQTEAGLEPGLVTGEECRVQYARVDAMSRAAREAAAAKGSDRERRSGRGIVDVDSLRASMKGQLDGQRGSSGTVVATEGGVGAEEEKPSGFSILQDSLKRDIEHIHRATRLQLPTMAAADDDDDDDDDFEDEEGAGADGELAETEEEDLRAATRSQVKAAAGSSRSRLAAQRPSGQQQAPLVLEHPRPAPLVQSSPIIARPVAVDDAQVDAELAAAEREVSARVERDVATARAAAAAAASRRQDGEEGRGQQRREGGAVRRSLGVASGRAGAEARGSSSSSSSCGEGSRQRPEDKEAWGFEEWVAFQEEQQAAFRDNQRQVFERVRVALGGAAMADGQGVAVEAAVESAWEARVQAEGQRREAARKREEERRQVRELEDMFARLRSQEQDPHYEAGGYAGQGDEAEGDEAAEEEEGGGLTRLELGMEEADLDELLAAIELDNQAADHGSNSQGRRRRDQDDDDEEEGGGSGASSSELRDVLRMLDIASNNRSSSSTSRGGRGSGGRGAAGGGRGSSGGGGGHEAMEAMAAALKSLSSLSEVQQQGGGEAAVSLELPEEEEEDQPATSSTRSETAAGRPRQQQAPPARPPMIAGLMMTSPCEVQEDEEEEEEEVGAAPGAAPAGGTRQKPQAQRQQQQEEAAGGRRRLFGSIWAHAEAGRAEEEDEDEGEEDEWRARRSSLKSQASTRLAGHGEEEEEVVLQSAWGSAAFREKHTALQVRGVAAARGAMQQQQPTAAREEGPGTDEEEEEEDEDEVVSGPAAVDGKVVGEEEEGAGAATSSEAGQDSMVVRASDVEEAEEEEAAHLMALGRAIFSRLPPPPSPTTRRPDPQASLPQPPEPPPIMAPVGSNEEASALAVAELADAAQARKAKMDEEMAEALQAYEAKKREYEGRMQGLRAARRKAELSSRLEAFLKTRKIKAELQASVRPLDDQEEEEEAFLAVRVKQAEEESAAEATPLPSTPALQPLPPSLSYREKAELSVLAFAHCLALHLPRLLAQVMTTASPGSSSSSSRLGGSGIGGRVSVLGLVLSAGTLDQEAKALHVPLPGTSSSSRAQAGEGAVLLLAVQVGEGAEEEEEAELEVFMRQVVSGLGPCCGPVAASVVEQVSYCSPLSSSSSVAIMPPPALLSPLDLFAPGIKLTTLARRLGHPPAHQQQPQQETVPVVVKPHAWGPGGASGLVALLDGVGEAGLYVAGARLLYLNQHDGHAALLPCAAEGARLQEAGGPTLVLALRGVQGLSGWAEAMGPEDPQLARLTDPTSLRARHGTDRRHNLAYSSPTQPARARREVAFWFGSRQATPQASPLCLPTLVLQPVARAVLVLDSRRCGQALSCGVGWGSASRFHALWSACLQYLVTRHGLCLTGLRVEPAPEEQLCGQQGPASGLVARAVLRGEGLSAGLLEAMARSALAAAAGTAVLPQLGLVAGASTTSVEEAAAMIVTDEASDEEEEEEEAMPSVAEVKRALAGTARVPAAAGGPTDPDVPQCVAVCVLPEEEAMGLGLGGAPTYLAELVSRLLLLPQAPRGAGPAAGGAEEGEGGLLEVLGIKFVHEPSPGLVEVLLQATTTAGGEEAADVERVRSRVSRGPVLVLALRGLQARRKVSRVLGPAPHSLALLEAPGSLRAKFGHDEEGGWCCVCLVSASARQTHTLLSHVFRPHELQDDPTYPHSQAPFLPPPVASSSSSSSPFLRLFPPPTPPVLDTLALLPLASCPPTGAAAARRLSRVLRRLERDECEVVDVRMVRLGGAALALVLEAWREAADRLLLRSSKTVGGEAGAAAAGQEDGEAALGRALASSPTLVLRLRRRNAVKWWNEARSVLSGGADTWGAEVPELMGPATYQAAQALLHALCPPGQSGGAHQSGSREEAQDSSLLLTLPSEPRRLERAARAGLSEAVCLVLLPCLLQHTPLSAIFDALQGKELRLVNVRRVQLSEEQARLYITAHRGGDGGGGQQAAIKGSSGRRPLKEQLDNLTTRRLSQEGPCLVLALESDNATARLLSLVLPTHSASSSGTGASCPPPSYRQQLGYGLNGPMMMGLSTDTAPPTAFTDSCHRQAAFSSWSSAVAGLELCLFFDQLHAHNNNDYRIITNPPVSSSSSSSSNAAAGAPSQPPVIAQSS